MRYRPKVLHLVYECIGAPTGGMGLHVQQLCKRTCNDFDITVVDFDMHGQKGAFWIVNRDGEYSPVPASPVQLGMEYVPTTPQSWQARPGEYRVLNVFGTNNFDAGGNVYIEQQTTLQMYRRNVARHFGNWRPDIICVHDSHLWWAAEVLRDRWGSKIVTTVHLSAELSNPALGKFLANLWIMHGEVTSYTQSDAVIAVSEHYREKLAKYAPCAVAILNGVGAEIWEQVEYSAAIRARYPRDCKKLVGFVGRLTPQKGIEFIVDAARGLPDHHFVIISHWHPMQGCETVAMLEAAEKELSNLVWERELSQPDKLRVMKVCDVGIVPSIFEPMGIVAGEWQGAGVPLIASNVGGLPEFCTPENSVSIEPTGVALTEALRDHKRNEQQITAGLETAKMLSWDTCAKKTAQVYEEVLKCH